ncbi:MAG: extracellular solute-binding protein [Anaerolineae bacterium]|nr:extracellular solute-binding protein [Anaerolineae bacterium]
MTEQQPTTNYQLPITDYRLPITHHASRITAHCLLLTACCLFLLTACQMGTPPRLEVEATRAAWTPTPTPEKLLLPVEGVPVATIPATEPTLPAAPYQSIKVWVNETSAEHRAALQQMATEFTAVNQIDVELMFVSPPLLPGLVNTAVLSNTLPDIIIHPLEYTAGWAEQGILNADAAETAVNQIGRDTFDPAALELVTAGGQIAALPSDGYKQLLIYRTDWFDEANLAVPDNFAAMLAAAEATTDRENLRAGFVIPTESNLVTTHQAFEQIALANGCDLIDDKGEVLLPEPPCREALDFYFRIVNQFSPIGVQTDTSTRNAYLAGRTGLIMAGPEMLPLLAGLDSALPPICPECADEARFLADNSDILTAIQGTGSTAAGFSNLRNLGITNAADVDTAVAFASFWFNEGYDIWLNVNSERKVPMRWGTAVAPTQFIDAWGYTGTPSLAELYGDAVIAQLRDGVAAAPRWGIRQGQGALLTSLYEKLTISITLQEMLSGYFNPAQTIIEAYNRVTAQIPNYQYDRDLENEVQETEN